MVEVAGQVKEISAATQEQAATMEENTAITEGNALASHELIETANTMSGQTEVLSSLVNKFKLTQTENPTKSNSENSKKSGPAKPTEEKK